MDNGQKQDSMDLLRQRLERLVGVGLQSTRRLEPLVWENGTQFEQDALETIISALNAEVSFLLRRSKLITKTP